MVPSKEHPNKLDEDPNYFNENRFSSLKLKKGSNYLLEKEG